jgi:hypothetical protein
VCVLTSCERLQRQTQPTIYNQCLTVRKDSRGSSDRLARKRKPGTAALLTSISSPPNTSTARLASAQVWPASDTSVWQNSTFAPDWANSSAVCRPMSAPSQLLLLSRLSAQNGWQLLFQCPAPVTIALCPASCILSSYPPRSIVTLRKGYPGFDFAEASSSMRGWKASTGMSPYPRLNDLRILGDASSLKFLFPYRDESVDKSPDRQTMVLCAEESIHFISLARSLIRA